MHASPRLLEVVALLSAVPAHGLLRGQVGTIVELVDGACEVEFSDNEGRTYAELAFPPHQLLVLHHRPQQPYRRACPLGSPAPERDADGR